MKIMHDANYCRSDFDAQKQLFLPVTKELKIANKTHKHMYKYNRVVLIMHTHPYTELKTRFPDLTISM